ncbi:MAG: hypothetical protein H6R17_3027 [Proteobacteria bacterium]|nr:hypothetical protein [Pseudomonadota bacterium]
MLKYFLLAVLASTAVSADADVFKCKGADGKVQFSDTACKADSTSELMPDRAPVTQQQSHEAQQRGQRLQNEAAALDEEKASARAAQQAQQQRQDSEAVKKSATAKISDDDAEAVATCVKDVERRGASQNVKAEMIAACRTAGSAQRSSGISSDAVSTCVRNVERTGASEKDKARQLALCHGGDVQPEPLPPPKPHPTTVTSCDKANCWDNLGGRYNKTGSKLIRSDGKVCQLIGNLLNCN